MPFRDDSAGAYGQWINDPNQSWLNYTRMKADDIAQGTRNVVSSLAGAFNPVTPNVIKPRGTYPGGASYNVLDWQVPPLVQEPINALSRIVGSPQNPGSLYDMSGVPEFDAPMKQDGLTSLLSMYGGNALRLPGRAAGGAKNALLKSAFERSQEPPNAIGDMWQAWNRADPNSTLHSDTGKPSILGNALAGAGEPQTVKAYHYSTDPTIGPKNKFYEWSHFGAADQAEDIFKGTASHANGEGSGATYPVELDIKNPFRIEDDGLNSPGTVGPHLWYMLDRAGYNPEQFYKMRADGTLPRALDDLLSQHGYDGLVYKNKFEGKGGKDSFIATRPNTVRSATTGETLFSDTGKPSIAGSALGANQNNLSIDDIVALYGR